MLSGASTTAGVMVYWPGGAAVATLTHHNTHATYTHFDGISSLSSIVLAIPPHTPSEVLNETFCVLQAYATPAFEALFSTATEASTAVQATLAALNDLLAWYNPAGPPRVWFDGSLLGHASGGDTPVAVLQEFCVAASTQPCVSLLFDARAWTSGVLGIAYVGGACQRGWSCAVLFTASPTYLLAVLLHEVGHLYGASHELSQCGTEDASVMRPHLSSSTRLAYSSCTEVEMVAWHEGVAGDTRCWTDEAGTPPTRPATGSLLLIVLGTVGGTLLLCAGVLGWWRHRVWRRRRKDYTAL